jgi:D-aminopeptidase
VGVLVLANYGASANLRIDGVPVGTELGAPPSFERQPAGSCIAVVATDAPLGPAQLTRLARRAGLGLARTGSVAHHGSGEIFVAFSTSARVPRGDPAPPSLPDRELDPLFLATVEATEEAVLNALWAAETTSGRDGRVFERLPHEAVLELLQAHGRLGA